MNYNFDYIKQSSRSSARGLVSRSYREDSELDYKVVKNATIVPGSTTGKEFLGGVVDEDNQYVPASGWREGQDCTCHVGAHDKVGRKWGTALYIGYFHNVWGHVITDNLKKLWILNPDADTSLGIRFDYIVYVTMDNRPLPEYVKNLLELAGVDFNNAIHITHPTMFDEVIIPDNSYLEVGKDRLFTDAYSETVNHIKIEAQRKVDEKPDLIDAIGSIIHKQPLKLYLTRSHLKGHRDTGESLIEQMFTGGGYQIVAPEEYTVLQQIFMLSRCDELITTEGSIGHNAVFCKPGTFVTLLRKADYINGVQLVVNEAANCDVTYVDANCSCFVTQGREAEGPFYMCVTDELTRYFKSKGIDECKKSGLPLWMQFDFWIYFMYSMYRKARTFMRLNVKPVLLKIREH